MTVLVGWLLNPEECKTSACAPTLGRIASPRNNRYESRSAQVPHREDNRLRMMVHTQAHPRTTQTPALKPKNVNGIRVTQLTLDLVDRSYALDELQRRRELRAMGADGCLHARVCLGPRAQMHCENLLAVDGDVDAGYALGLGVEQAVEIAGGVMRPA